MEQLMVCKEDKLGMVNHTLEAIDDMDQAIDDMDQCANKSKSFSYMFRCFNASYFN